MRYLPYLLALALAGLGYWVGVERTENHYQAERTRIQSKLFDLAEELSIKERELEEYRHAQATLVEQIEKEIRADSDTARPGIGNDGMRRLERRWGIQD